MTDEVGNDGSGPEGSPIYVLTLYIYGKSKKSERAIENLHHICEVDLQGRFELEIIDIKENPAAASEKMLVAFPTLVRKHPTPIKRLVVGLSDRRKVLAGLEIALNET